MMHATPNQCSIMQPQINTQEQSRVNQKPDSLSLASKNGLFGIHDAPSPTKETRGGRVGVSAAHLRTNELPYMFRPNTPVNRASRP